MSIRLHVVDHEKNDGHQAGTLLNRSFYLDDVPRLMVLCRPFGHRPVIDGYDTTTTMTRDAARWVACRRCGVRPDPQGDLDPDQWKVGQRYPGPFAAVALPSKSSATTGTYTPPKVPGSWPPQPTTQINGQLVIGNGQCRSLGITLKVGNDSSENALGGHIALGRLGALHLSFGDFGRGVQRRLNSRTYESRVIQVAVHDRTLWWKAWAPRDSWSTGTPRWMNGATALDPRDRWLGPVRHDFEKIGQARPGRVTMPEGDTHDVTLLLEKVRTGRRRGRKAESWSVDWASRAGIPFRNHSWKGDGVHGSSVQVSAAAVERGRWPEEACALIAASVARDRSRYGWRPDVPYDWPQPDYNAEFDIEVI